MKHQVNSHKSAEDCGKGHSSVSFTYDRYGHLFPEVDSGAAAKLDVVRTFGLGGRDGSNRQSRTSNSIPESMTNVKVITRG